MTSPTGRCIFRALLWVFSGLDSGIEGHHAWAGFRQDAAHPNEDWEGHEEYRGQILLRMRLLGGGGPTQRRGNSQYSRELKKSHKLGAFHLRYNITKGGFFGVETRKFRVRDVWSAG